MAQRLFTSRGTRYYRDIPMNDAIVAKGADLPGFTVRYSPDPEDFLLNPPEGYIRVLGKTEDELTANLADFNSWIAPVGAIEENPALVVKGADTSEIAAAISKLPRIVESVENCTGFLALYGGTRPVSRDKLAIACERRRIKPPTASRASALARALRKIPNVTLLGKGKGRATPDWDVISSVPRMGDDGNIVFPKLGTVQLSSGPYDPKDPIRDLVWTDTLDDSIQGIVNEAYKRLRYVDTGNGKHSEMLSAGEVSAWLAGTNGQIQRLGALDIPHRGSAFFPKGAGDALAALRAVVREADCANITICPVDHRSNADIARDLVVGAMESAVAELRQAGEVLLKGSTPDENAKLALRRTKKARMVLADVSANTGLAFTLLTKEIKSMELQISRLENEAVRQEICQTLAPVDDAQSSYFAGVVSEALKENNVFDIEEEINDFPLLDLRDTPDNDVTGDE